jgi:hypothetical protein
MRDFFLEDSSASCQVRSAKKSNGYMTVWNHTEAGTKHTWCFSSSNSLFASSTSLALMLRSERERRNPFVGVSSPWEYVRTCESSPGLYPTFTVNGWKCQLAYTKKEDKKPAAHLGDSKRFAWPKEKPFVVGDR